MFRFQRLGTAWLRVGEAAEWTNTFRLLTTVKDDVEMQAETGLEDSVVIVLQDSSAEQLDTPGHTWSYLDTPRHPGHTWTHTDTPERRRAARLTWIHLVTPGHTWTYLDTPRHPGHTWSHLDTPGHSWTHLDTPGQRRAARLTWIHLVTPGLTLTRLDTRKHTLTAQSSLTDLNTSGLT